MEENLVSVETHNKKGREENFREDILEEGVCGGTKPHEKGREKTGREDILMGAECGGMTPCGPLTPETMYKENGECDEEASMVVKLRLASTSSLQEHKMMANKPDTLPCMGDCKPAGNWMFDLNFESGADKGRLTDADTIILVASEETMCCRPWQPGNENTLEEHEIGPGPKLIPDLPFVVGDIIMCDIPGRQCEDLLRLQQGFVLKADHPRYRIKLEDGETVWTHIGKSWLRPRWAPGQFAPDQDNPFVKEKGNKNLKLGSYGIHVNSQQDLLRKIQEAKEFAKAVKADDAEIPVYLWNNRVKSPGITQERQDAELTAFQKLGFRWFMCGLTRDCVAYMRETHGTDWVNRRRTKGESLTELGRDQAAIAGMLWHSTHTNWFDFHASSRLAHLRFPIWYQKMAQDGVPVYFEWPGPTTRKAQPIVADAGMRAKVKEKIFKMVKRRYLLMTGIKVKSLIKYFAVPKGEDNICLVYDATANKLNDCVWVPTFWLPTINSLVRALDKDSWMMDCDIGDMF